MKAYNFAVLDFPKETNNINFQLHVFSDASTSAYVGVVYLEGINDSGRIHMSIVIDSQNETSSYQATHGTTLRIVWAVVLAKLISHVARILDIPADQTYAWTDSLVVLSWLKGNRPNSRYY